MQASSDRRLVLFPVLGLTCSPVERRGVDTPLNKWSIITVRHLQRVEKGSTTSKLQLIQSRKPSLLSLVSSDIKIDSDEFVEARQVRLQVTLVAP